MTGITLEIAEKHLDAWLEAELAVTTNQSYTIGSRTLTRANLSEIRKQNVLQNAANRKGRNRTYRIVPRDL